MAVSATAAYTYFNNWTTVQGFLSHTLIHFCL